MGEFGNELMKAMAASDDKCIAWCVLPNHYHLLVAVSDLHQNGEVSWTAAWAHIQTMEPGGRLHRTAVLVSLCATAPSIQRHMWAAMNYVHHNPVKHRLREKVARLAFLQRGCVS